MKAKNITKKLNKFLSKKVTIIETIGSILLVLFIILLGVIIALKIMNKQYSYENYKNDIKRSDKCLKAKDGYLYCQEYEPAIWYVEV